MQVEPFGFGYQGTVQLNFDRALARTKDALAAEGFGVQAEIDISQALKTKLGVQIPREIILGVCNPGLAHRAIQQLPEITVLLPCNVTVREQGEATHIAAVNAEMLVNVTNNPALREIAAEAQSRLMSALRRL